MLLRACDCAFVEKIPPQPGSKKYSTPKSELKKVSSPKFQIGKKHLIPTFLFTLKNFHPPVFKNSLLPAKSPPPSSYCGKRSGFVSLWKRSVIISTPPLVRVPIWSRQDISRDYDLRVPLENDLGKIEGIIIMRSNFQSFPIICLLLLKLDN